MSSAAEWRQLIDEIDRLPDGQPTAALATLIRTRGSTFRRAGTRMLVHADGRVVCELSGGCPQQDIVERAKGVIASNAPVRVRYDATSGLDVLIEMGCGGELEVLLEPVVRDHALAWLAPLLQALAEHRPARLATWFVQAGDVRLPRRQLADERQVRYDNLDDPALAQALTDYAMPSSAATVPLPCVGGTADVLVEPIQPPLALVVIGSSAAARALWPLAATLGWPLTLVDANPRHLEAAPAAAAAVCAEPARLRERIALDAHTAVLLMTHNLAQDIAYLQALDGATLAYVGALGSRERVARMREALGGADLPLYGPAGLDIGSDTPAEIALAIVTEILAVTRGRGGGSLRDATGAIHP